MTVRRLKEGSYQCDVTIDGQRIRKQFKTRIEAKRYEQLLLSRSDSFKPWLSNDDKRTLTELFTLWFEYHGQSLRDGERRFKSLLEFARRLNNPVSKHLKPTDFLKYRSARLNSGLTEKTLNNELGYIRAVFNELKSLGVIDYDNPLQSVKPFKILERELTFLNNNQIDILLSALSASANPHVKLITIVCLMTGARWSEVERLKPSSLNNGFVTFSKTKSGKNRTIPISSELEEVLLNHFSKHGEFTFSLSAFRRALNRSGIELPRGQASHVLRHTFASHFMQQGGNILTLKKILGHSSLTMTMRYSHLSPEHLQDAVFLNPLSHVVRLSSVQEILE